MNQENCIKYGLIIFAGFVLLYLISEYNLTLKKREAEKFSTNPPTASLPVPSQSSYISSSPAPAPPIDQNASRKSVSFSDSVANQQVQASASPAVPAECFPRDKLSATDLLPKDAANSAWSKANPAGQGSITDQNFLNAGYHVGINTIGTSLRNPSYDLRSEPANPKTLVSPWMQSTIDPDLTRKPLEIGGC